MHGAKQRIQWATTDGVVGTHLQSTQCVLCVYVVVRTHAKTHKASRVVVFNALQQVCHLHLYGMVQGMSAAASTEEIYSIGNM